jgi:Zn-dependent peptidase ImmA (M78 family)
LLSGYNLTEIERKVEKLYKEKDILTPSDLTIKNVAEKFNVHLDFSDGPQRAIWEDDFSVIFLNPNLPEERQREVFYHELAHPIMHCGDQTKMKNKTFRDLQEAQANLFQLYAAIPFFMLQQLELPAYEYQIIELIKNVFKVTPAFAKKRLEQIKRRIIQNKMDHGFLKAIEPNKLYGIKESFTLIEDLFTTDEIHSFFTPKKKKKPVVYYDISQGKPVQLWYCINVERGEVNWSMDAHRFPIDAEFELTPINEFVNKDYDAPITLAELKLLPSYPNDFAIDLKTLKRVLLFYDVDPYNIRRFVIDANHLEQLLQLDIFSTKLCNYQQLTN